MWHLNSLTKASLAYVVLCEKTMCMENCKLKHQTIFTELNILISFSGSQRCGFESIN